MNSMMFSGIGCFEGMFAFQVKDGSCPYQVSSRRVAYVQKKKILVSLDMDETSEWCNSFTLVPKANSKVRLCLDPARLYKALMRVVHSGLI